MDAGSPGTPDRAPSYYRARDISLVISLRVHDGNPWVLPRLRMLAGHYSPMPGEVVIVDLGSQAPHAEAIQALCRTQGFRYLRVEDTETYSAAVGRNRGAEIATRPLMFLSDIDCFGEHDLFDRLATHGNRIDLARCFDQIINLPAYHLTEGATQAVSVAPVAERPHLVGRAMGAAVCGAREHVVEYVDPFSNFLLIRRDFFSLVGGYNENFRGHGSEDYEFLLRCAAESRQFPLPRAPEKDCNAPLRNDFFAQRRPFEGFRRLGELIAYPAEAAGLRIAHLHHPRAPSDTWYARRDVRRQRLQDQVRPYLSRPSVALSYDWLQRPQRALVVLGPGRAARDLALPLRLAGYALEPFVVTDQVDREAVARRLSTCHALVIVEPGLKSAALALQDCIDLAGDRVLWSVRSLNGSAEDYVYAQYTAGQCVFHGVAQFARYQPPAFANDSAVGLLFEHLPFEPLSVARAARFAPFAPDSYASGKLALGLAVGDIEAERAHLRRLQGARTGSWQARARKLFRTPHRFFADSSHAPLRTIGSLLFDPAPEPWQGVDVEAS